MSAEEDRIKENATTLAKVTTAVFPAHSLAPWMSHYDKRTEAVIVMAKTIGDVAEELERQKWLKNHPDEETYPGLDGKAEKAIAELEKLGWNADADKKQMLVLLKTQLAKKQDDEELEEELFDLEKLNGADYMFAFCLNSMAKNMHNHAPSIDGIRTKQGIAMAKASNPGMSVQPDQPKKSLFQRIKSIGQQKDQAT